jgi:hypothetical protein
MGARKKRNIEVVVRSFGSIFIYVLTGHFDMTIIVILKGFGRKYEGSSRIRAKGPSE